MKLRNLVVVGVAVLGALAPSAAQALPITVSYEAAPIGPGLTDFGTVGSPLSWSFQRFNPALGALLSMTLEFEAGLSSVLDIVNNSGSASTGEASTRFRLRVDDDGLNLPGTEIDASWGDGVTPCVNLVSPNCYAYSLPAGGSTSSGPLNFFATYSQNFTNFTNGALLTNFTGVGFETLSYYTVTSTQQSNTGGNTDVTQETTAALTGRVIYEYEASVAPPPSPVPEPSSMLLLGSGLVALGYSVRRKKS